MVNLEVLWHVRNMQKDIYQSQGHKTSQAFFTGKMFQWNSGQLHIQLDQGVYNFNMVAGSKEEMKISQNCNSSSRP
jgi:hypothetical protein